MEAEASLEMNVKAVVAILGTQVEARLKIVVFED